jgi:hypothetical protein
MAMLRPGLKWIAYTKSSYVDAITESNTWLETALKILDDGG